MECSYILPIIGIILFISGMTSLYLSVPSSHEVDYIIILVTIGIFASGLMIIGGSFMHIGFGKKNDGSCRIQSLQCKISKKDILDSW